MKLLKLLAVGLAAVIGASSAMAQTTIKITGSTALRKAVYNGIVNSLNSPVGCTLDGTATDMSGANRSVISGTLKSGPSAGQTVVFQLAFAGSVGGVQALAQTLSTIPGASFTSGNTWMSNSNTKTALTSSGGVVAGATVNASPAFDGASAPDVSGSDAFQSTTPYKTPVLNEENPAGNGVGIIDFYWVKGVKHGSIPQASYDAFTTMTTLNSQLLLANGALPLSVFTGNLSDSNYDVILVGRNNDSGTRLVTQAETGYALGGQKPESQFQPNTTSGNITGWNFVGDNGYDSGSKVAAALNRPVSGGGPAGGTGYIFVGYMGKSDKNTATGGATPGSLLAWNGKTTNAATLDEVENGAYTFWSYYHIYYRSGLPTVAKNAVDLASNQVRTVDAANGGLLLTQMNVTRLIEGGLVSP